MSKSAILTRFNNFLNQPYPFYYRGRALAIISTVIFIAVFLFGYLFEPFVVYAPEHRMNYVFICLLHALVPAVLYFLFFHLLQRRPAIDETWTVGKEIAAMFPLLIIIGIGQFLIRDLIYNNPNNWSWHYLFEELRNTMLVGILFSFVFVPANFNRLFRSNQDHAQALMAVTDQPRMPLDAVPAVIRTQVKADDFVLDINRFLFARAEKNYVELFLAEDGANKKLLKRMSMKDLEAQLGHLPFLMKTHRSYLVNLRAIESLGGNAQGYKLKLRDYPETVPVSRNLIPAFEEKRKAGR